MASTLSKPPSHQRHPSRSNSASSSSIATVQRAITLSSRNGKRPAITGLRSQSPNETSSIPSNLSARTLSPDPKRRSSAVYNRPDSSHGLREGVGNLNRWSQSTVSSNHSGSHNRRNSFSKRLSGSFGSFGGFIGEKSPSPSGKTLAKPRQSPKISPLKVAPPTHPAPTLPPIVTLSSLHQAVDAADSPSTAATTTPATADLLSPSVYKPNEADYFGERWRSRTDPKPKPKGKRSSTAPSPITISQSPKRTLETDRIDAIQPSSPGAPLISAYSNYGPSQISRSDRRLSRQGHSRNRDEPNKSSGGTEAESSASSIKSSRDPNHRRKPPSQKAMLSKALQKANHAVLLDNAQNFEGAMAAYSDACNLLQQVMLKSTGQDDRRKLEAVRNTYTNRIFELQNTDFSHQRSDGKALPDRPRDRVSKDTDLSSPIGDDEIDETIEMATTARLGSKRPYTSDRHASSAVQNIDTTQNRQSYLPPAQDVYGRPIEQTRTDQNYLPIRSLEAPTNYESTMYTKYLPPPLSPRRPVSPIPPPKDYAESFDDAPLTDWRDLELKHHARHDTAETTSWLDTIDESGGSSGSSVHSRTSSIGLRRKHIRPVSGQTEAEFDAALDAAVEAAYDDGLEPDDIDEDGLQMHYPDHSAEEIVSASQVNRKIELARENVREAEREAAVALAKEKEKRRLLDKPAARDSIDIEYGDDEADEEERLLEEMTRDYIIDDREYNMQSKSALPRQSDSSGFSGRTWGSSIGSNPTSAGTSLSAVAEAPALPSMASKMHTKPMPPPSHPPPLSALPPPPAAAAVAGPSSASRPPSLGTIASPGVRERRLSGMKAKQLKIETNPKVAPNLILEAPKTQPLAVPSPMISAQAVSDAPKSASLLAEPPHPQQSTSFKPPPLSTQTGLRKDSSPLSGASPGDLTASTGSVTPALTKVTSIESEGSIPSMPGSPAQFSTKSSKRPVGLRKTFSSSSLRNKSLTVSTSEAVEASSNASLSSLTSTPKGRRGVSATAPSLPTPVGTNFMINPVSSGPIGGIYLFDSDMHSPTSPGSPNPQASNPPLPLEPCPESSLLRPFWFLRCIYHTIAHPRGGYISSRLFLPRDIWRVKNVKLKNLEEKISSCDLLTAALLKLARVDTLDANAVLEEMQFLESVMDQAQTTLSKKLGSDVGVAGASGLLKGTNVMDESHPSSEALALAQKSSTSGSKSYLSWRKIRGKNSMGPAPLPVNTTVAAKDGTKEAPTMSSLPMTNTQKPRFAKRELSQVQYVGQNANYMGALARLCDAVQVLDQIARQVEDPGLKHSSSTHVGLELSMRHAAEFFGFFVCRYLLIDIGILLDKYIKRGTEWVLA